MHGIGLLNMTLHPPHLLLPVAWLLSCLWLYAPTQPMKDAVFGLCTIHWHTRMEFCVAPPAMYSTS